MNVEMCPGCRSEFIKADMVEFLRLPIIVHPYIGASEACWRSYGMVLAHEFSNPAYFLSHRITVDAYCAQHPGNQKDRRARQSVTLHAIALYLFFEQTLSTDGILSFLKHSTQKKHDYFLVSLPTFSAPWLTVKDVNLSLDPSPYQKRILEWGESVWQAYKPLENDLKEIFSRIYDA